MIDNSSTDRSSGQTIEDGLDGITVETALRVNTIADLWSLAKMVKDMEGDPIWDALHQMDCDPEPFDNLGYAFKYHDYNGIYIPKRNGKEVVRFALPKLASVDSGSRERLMESVNAANSLVMESKFMVMGEDVWLLHERNLSGQEDYFSMVEHILENLKSGAELFCKIY